MTIACQTWEALLDDLSVDGACTVGQALRNRGRPALARLVSLGLARVVPAPYRPTARARRTVVVPVVLLTAAGEEEARRRGIEPWRVPRRKLAHAIGMSELRAVLGLDPRAVVRGPDLEAAWVRAGIARSGVPDALFCSGGEMVALEYDHGKYTGEQVAAKLQAAPLLSDRLVWGVPSRARAAWLRGMGVSDVLVLSVPLWPGV
jgi:hypothetical protein